MVGDGARARRHRGARRGDPHAPARVGSERARRRVRRSARRLPHVQGALPRRQARGRAVPAEAVASIRASTRHCQLTEPRQFNLMFKTFMGPVEETRVRRLPAAGDGAGHLRELPERAAVARGRRCRSASRRSARRSATRSRRGTSSSARASSSRWRCSSSSSRARTMEWFEYWKEQRMEWHHALGLAPERLRFHEHARASSRTTRAPRSTSSSTSAARSASRRSRASTIAATSISSRHQEYSGKKLEYFDQPKNKRYVPFVIETSVGADRATLAVLVNAYREEAVEGEEEGRTVLGLHPSLAPIKAAVFPLTKKDGMPEMAHKHRERAAAALPGGLRRDGQHRQALPPAGRSRHAVLHHGRRRHDEGRHGDDPRSRHAEAGSHRRRRAARATSGSGCRR